MTTAEKKIEIPAVLLEQLKRKSERSATLTCVREILLEENVIQGGECGWNSMINWLETNHPGWRGYEVQYPCGWVG